MSEDGGERAFGLRLYEALCALGRRDVATGGLDHAGVQKLKDANRDETCALFEEHHPGIAKIRAYESPEALAAYLSGFRDGVQHGVRRRGMVGHPFVP